MMRILAVAQHVGGGDSSNWAEKKHIKLLNWGDIKLLILNLARAEYLCSRQYALYCLEKT